MLNLRNAEQKLKLRKYNGFLKAPLSSNKASSEDRKLSPEDSAVKRVRKQSFGSLRLLKPKFSSCKAINFEQEPEKFKTTSEILLNLKGNQISILTRLKYHE